MVTAGRDKSQHERIRATLALISAALEALAPRDDEALRWALKRAIVQTARRVRIADRIDRFIGRAELRRELETLAEDARRLRQRTRKLAIWTALALAFRGWKSREDLAEARAAIDALMKGWDDLPRVLDAIEVCAPLAVDKLGLKGRRGSVGPWARYRPTAKVLLSATGRMIFEEARRSRLARARAKEPKRVVKARRNPDLHQFLSLLWEIATGEPDVMEWEAALRAPGAGAKIDDENARAWVEARMSGHDLNVKIGEWQLARNLLKHPDAAPPGFHSAQKVRMKTRRSPGP